MIEHVIINLFNEHPMPSNSSQFLEETTLRQLADLLNTGEHFYLETLTERLGVSERQVRRLLDKLRKKGMKIQVKTPKRETQEEAVERKRIWYIDPKDLPVKILDIQLTEEQVLALAVAAEASLAALVPTPLGEPLKNAFSILLEKLSKDIEIDPEDEREYWHFSPNTSASINPLIFRTLTLAIQDNCRVRIDYYSAYKNQFSTDRLINPYGMAVRGGSWLLVAYCHKNQEIRDFSLAGISQARMGDETEIFDRPDDFDLAEYFRFRFSTLGGGNIYHVLIRVESDRAAYFHRKKYHPSQEIKPLDDGALEVSFTVSGLEEVRSFAQGWGVGITVLKPLELRKRMEAEAEELHRRYRELKAP